MLIGLLSFYDEEPETLAACVHGLARAGVRRLVAIDGRYAAFPAAPVRSAHEQLDRVRIATRARGMTLLALEPDAAFATEPEKRTMMFRLGLAAASSHDDWFLQADADEVVLDAPDLETRLAATDLDCAELVMRDVDGGWTMMHRRLFRAAPIIVGPRHSMYRHADGTLLWDGGAIGREVPALELPDVIVEHRHSRSPQRELAREQYYEWVRQSGVELGECVICGEQSVRRVPLEWRQTDTLPVSDFVDACETHAAELEERGREQLVAWGCDPDLPTVPVYRAPN